jgi:hypothetical protein
MVTECLRIRSIGSQNGQWLVSAVGRAVFGVRQCINDDKKCPPHVIHAVAFSKCGMGIDDLD